MSFERQAELSVASLADGHLHSRFAVLKAFLDDSSLFSGVDNVQLVAQQLLAEPLEQTFEGALCSLAVVSELWFLGKEEERAALGSLINHAVPLTRTAADETTCKTYERLTFAMLSRPLKPTAIIENFFLMMKDANITLLARVCKQFLGRASDDMLVSMLANPWVSIAQSLKKQPAAWHILPPVVQVREATAVAIQSCGRLIRGTTANTQPVKLPLQVIAVFSAELSDVDMKDVASKVLALLLCFQRLTLKEDLPSDFLDFLGKSRMHLWNRLTAKIGAELVKFVSSPDCSLLQEFQVEVHYELFRLLTEVPLQSVALHEILETVFSIMPESCHMLLLDDETYFRLIAKFTTTFFDKASTLSDSEAVLFKYCFHPHPMCRKLALELWCSIIRSCVGAPESASSIYQRYISVIVDLVRAMQSSILQQEGVSTLSSNREQVRRDLKSVVDSVLQSLPYELQPEVSARLLQSTTDDTWVFYVMDILPTWVLARQNPNFLLQTTRLFAAAMKICCSGAISPSNVLAFRALAKLLSESTLISQVRPELVVNAMELGVRMTARCLSEPSASGSARDWRLLQSALELVIASPRPLELKHLNDILFAMNKGKQTGCVDMSHRVALAHFFADITVSNRVSRDVCARILQALDELASDSDWVVASAATIAASSIQAVSPEVVASPTLKAVPLLLQSGLIDEDIFPILQDASVLLDGQTKLVEPLDVQADVAFLRHRLDQMLNNIPMGEEFLFQSIAEAKAKLDAAATELQKHQQETMYHM